MFAYFKSVSVDIYSNVVVCACIAVINMPIFHYQNAGTATCKAASTIAFLSKKKSLYK